MSENRAAKSGLAKDLQDKNKQNYKQDQAKDVMDWISRVIGEPLDSDGSPESVEALLKDGIVLCKLYKAIDPSCNIDLAKEKTKNMPFHKMERIERVLALMKQSPLCIKAHCCFATSDLYDGENLRQVITCLSTVGGACHCDSVPVAGFGVKPTEGQKRHFTEEQLAQGKSVIGLQMGSNKGASQAGQNFGKTRMITD